MSEHDDDAFWRSVTDNPAPGLTDVDSLETIVHNLAPYVDYRHEIASEGQGADISTSRDGAAGSRDGHHDPPTTIIVWDSSLPMLCVTERVFVLKQ